MPINTQFGLTLELTRLVPLSLIGNAAQNAVMTLARELRNSGSDILIEENLAQLFGRSRIDSQMASSFRTVVSKGNDTPLSNDIHILGGPGATVRRALQESRGPYFATLVQISLLTSVFEAYGIAKCFADILETRYEKLPDNYVSPPDHRGVFGTLTAIEEQTSMFNWHALLLAINSTLGEDPPSISHTFDGPILEALMDMLPLAQTLPLDRMIHLETGRGVACIVAWAHHILGLTVRVKNVNGKEVIFGKGQEQLLVEPEKYPASTVTLYDSSGESNDILFRVDSSDDSDWLLHATYKIPLRGYGKSELHDHCYYYTAGAAILQDLIAITVALCRLVHAALDSGDGRFVFSEPDRRSVSRLMEAAKIFFDCNISESSVLRYMNVYRDLWERDRDVEPPASVSTLSESELSGSDLKTTWHGLLNSALELIAPLLCLAFVHDLPSAADITLGSHVKLDLHPFKESLSEWDGCAPLSITEGTMFEMLLLLLHSGPNPIQELEGISIFTSHGWSIYLTAFNPEDPAAVPVEQVRLIHGVPYRNNVRIGCLLDGAEGGASRNNMLQGKVYGRGDILTPPFPSKFKSIRGKALFSQENDFFRCVVPFKSESADKSGPLSIQGGDGTSTGGGDSGTEWLPLTLRVGYRTLHRCLWRAMPSIPCTHHSGTPFTLPMDCEAITTFPDEMKWLEGDRARIVICLTEKNSGARWRALVAWIQESPICEPRNYLLRTNNCCLGCLVAQAASRPGKWVIIL